MLAARTIESTAVLLQGGPEGAVVTVFEQEGEFARIRGADGRTGWVLAVTLVPLGGAASAAPSPGVVASTPVVRPTSPAAPAAPAGTAAPTSAPGPGSGRLRVMNTDGQGVALRAAPDGERLNSRGYAEGTVVTVLERSGTWTHIRGDDGRDGWVPTVTLGPT